MNAMPAPGRAAAWPADPDDPLAPNRAWEVDRALQLERSERRAWQVAAAGILLGLVGIAAVFVQGPLRYHRRYRNYPTRCDPGSVAAARYQTSGWVWRVVSLFKLPGNWNSDDTVPCRCVVM